MSITGRQLAVGMGLAGLVHAAVAAAVFWAPPPPGTQAVGLGGVEVSLGPAGGAPGDVAAVAPAETAPPVETAETPPEVAPTEAAPVEAVRPVEPEAVIPVETVEPPEQVVEAKPVVPPPPRRKPEPPEPDVVETPPEPAPSVAGAPGKAGTLDSTEAGSSADASSGGESPGASADYMSYLLAWLQKHKEYPTEARRRRQEGTALLYFEMDRQGHVRNFRLQRSSGHEALDEEVLALIERTQPLPAPPPEVKGETVKLIVPVQFFLR